MKSRVIVLTLAGCASGLRPLVRPAVGSFALAVQPVHAADFATVKGLAADFPVVEHSANAFSGVPQLGLMAQLLVFVGMLDIAFKGDIIVSIVGVLELLFSGELFDDDDDDDYYWDDDEDYWW